MLSFLQKTWATMQSSVQTEPSESGFRITPISPIEGPRFTTDEQKQFVDEVNEQLVNLNLLKDYLEPVDGSPHLRL